MAETIFLTLEQVLVIHDDQIERSGGRHGIRSLSLLESALVRSQASFGGQDLYPTIFDKAAALVYSLILNHSFVDGNKRTAVVSAILFLGLNGYKFEVGNEELFQAALKIEAKDWEIGQISRWFKIHSKKRR